MSSPSLHPVLSFLPRSMRLAGVGAALAALHLSQAAALEPPAVGLAPAATASRIAQVKVYPGSATVERVARVAAGSRSVTFSCLPAGLDAQSLQVSADASVRVGETSVLTQPRALSAACSDSPLDGRIRALEDQKAALQAEQDALGYVTGYLQALGKDGDGRQPALDARSLAATADAMRRTGQDSLLRRHQIERRKAELDRQLQPLLAEHKRSQGGSGGQVTAVTITLDAPREAELHLSYQVAGPGWTPAYRALLDSNTRKVRIERQALVAQATGEDWRGVKLVLSTGQPRQNTAGRTPTPWRVDVQPPPEAEDRRQRRAPAAEMAMAPAPIAQAGKMDAKESRPLFDVNVFQGSFATEFNVAQPIDVPSNGQRVAMPLGQHEDSAQLAVRISPALEEAGYLVAELAQPEGVWPAGALQLYRDGAFVGNGRWSAPANIDGPARLTLSFGRDELVRVQAEAPRDNQGTGGFVGNRAERRLQRAYRIENRHRTPIAVEVLEAAPVSVNDQVRVAAQFSPQPAELAWNKQPGVAMWRSEIAAGQGARFAADYTISYPKEARLQER